MSAAPRHDLSDLMKWTARDGWRSRVDAVMAEHFEPAMRKFGLAFEQIDDALGGTWTRTLRGCAFEDFLTRRFGPGDENPVESYLRRNSWKERALTRSYMAALQASVMSLYEVSAVVPGESFRARDLIRSGDPVLVSECTATAIKLPGRAAAPELHNRGIESQPIASAATQVTAHATRMNSVMEPVLQRESAKRHRDGHISRKPLEVSRSPTRWER